MTPQPNNNGAGRAPVVDTVPVSEDCGPTGVAYPLVRNAPQLSIRREMVFGVVGVAVGVGLTLWIMSICSKRLR